MSTRALIRAIVGYAGGGALAKAIPALLLPVYGRLLTPAEFGIVGTTTALLTLVSMLGAGGLHGALSRLFFDASESSQHRRLNGSVLFGWGLVVGPLLVALVAAAYWLPDGVAFAQIPNVPYLLATVLAAPGGAIVLIVLAAYRARENVLGYVTLQVGNEGLKAAGVLVGVWLLSGGATGQVWGVAAGASIAGLAALGVFVRFGVSIPKATMVREALVLGWPLTVSGVASWALLRGNRVILERFATLDEVGVFSMAAMLTQLLGTLVMSFNQAWAPRYFRLEADGRSAAEEAAGYARLLVGVVSICGLLLVAIGPELLVLVGGDHYQAAIGFLPLLVVGQIVQSWYFIRVNQIIWTKRNVLVPQLNGAAAFVTVVGGVLLIPWFGGYGAAIGMAAGGVVLAALADRVGNRVRPVALPVVRLLAAMGVAVGAIIVLAILSPGTLMRFMVGGGGVLIVLHLLMHRGRIGASGVAHVETSGS